MLRTTPPTAAAPPDHQLALPLEFPSPAPPPAVLLEPLRSVPLERVWTSLPLASQQRIRQTVLRVLEEVVHDCQQPE